MRPTETNFTGIFDLRSGATLKIAPVLLLLAASTAAASSPKSLSPSVIPSGAPTDVSSLEPSLEPSFQPTGLPNPVPTSEPTSPLFSRGVINIFTIVAGGVVFGGLYCLIHLTIKGIQERRGSRVNPEQRPSRGGQGLRMPNTDLISPIPLAIAEGQNQRSTESTERTPRSTPAQFPFVQAVPMQIERVQPDIQEAECALIL